MLSFGYDGYGLSTWYPRKVVSIQLNIWICSLEDSSLDINSRYTPASHWQTKGISSYKTEINKGKCIDRIEGTKLYPEVFQYEESREKRRNQKKKLKSDSDKGKNLDSCDVLKQKKKGGGGEGSINLIKYCNR